MSMGNVQDSDEIDLAKLFGKLWQGRWIVVTWIVTVVLIALCYSLLRTPIYKIEAIISPSQSSSLIPIQPSILNVDDVHTVPLLSEKVVYNSVLLQLNSTNVLREFWSNYSSGKGGGEKGFRAFVNGLSIESVNPRGEEPQSRKISVKYANAEKGAEALDTYLAFLNERIQTQFLEDMNRSFKASVVKVDSSISLLEENGQKNLSYELLILKENYEIAKSLKITSTPYKDLENIGLTILDGRDYLLGTDALSLQINTLSARQGKSLRAFNKRINDLFLARSIIESDIARLAEFKNFVPMFKVENRAESSIDPIGPRKFFLLIGGLIAGLVLGCSHVLLLNLIRQNGN